MYSSRPFSTRNSVALKLKYGSNSFSSRPNSAPWNRTIIDIENASTSMPITSRWLRLNSWLRTEKRRVSDITVPQAVHMEYYSFVVPDVPAGASWILPMPDVQRPNPGADPSTGERPLSGSCARTRTRPILLRPIIGVTPMMLPDDPGGMTSHSWGGGAAYQAAQPCLGASKAQRLCEASPAPSAAP